MRYDEIQCSKVERVQLVDRLGAEPNVLGTFHVTTTHIIFKADDGGKEIWVPNGLIGSVERGPLSAAGCPLTIRCKHFMQFHLLIGRDKLCQDLYLQLLRSSTPVNVNDLWAFESRDVGEDSLGWKRLDWAREFSRQGVDEAQWVETDMNDGYAACDTYPDRLWVPLSANKSVLTGSCRFRSRGRLPALTYFHRPNSATLCRCAQPLTGFSARCVEDEKLMELIARTNPHTDTLFLVDTRPRVNAIVNKVQGKGFEDERNYTNMRFHFFDIENIHVMRSSQAKLVDACTKSRQMSDYLKQVESSGWLRHVRNVLECANFLASSIAKGVSCVVHCSDGWDRTSQTVALAQMLLDPFYRTVHGFQVLIEKDWLGFGHKFDERCGHVGALNAEAEKEVSPVFTQFLDAVWQVAQLRPRAFEFNERFLVELHEHAYSCLFGTFIGNCDKDRKDLALAKRTKSLWTYMDARKDDYINPYYEPTLFGVLVDVDFRAANIRVWNGLYNRFDDGLRPRESREYATTASREHVGVLEQHVAAMMAKVSELKQQLGKSSSTMADSGHSSANGSGGGGGGAGMRDPLGVGGGGPSPAQTPLTRQNTQESGVYDASFSFSEGDVACPALSWQSLREVDGCATRDCTGQFIERGERRAHCHKCGKIYCWRCLTRDDKEHMCRGCHSKTGK